MVNKPDSHLIVYLQAVTVNFIYLVRILYSMLANLIKIPFTVHYWNIIFFLRIRVSYLCVIKRLNFYAAKKSSRAFIPGYYWKRILAAKNARLVFISAHYRIDFLLTKIRVRYLALHIIGIDFFVLMSKVSHLSRRII